MEHGLNECRRDDMKDLRCMSFSSRGSSEILVAGCQNVMFKIDAEKGEVLQTVCLEDGRKDCQQ